MLLDTPPDDFRLLNVVPNGDDISSDLRPFVRPNITKGMYPNAETYLDIQFRLLREDFFSVLRRGIQSYKKFVKQNVQAVSVENLYLYSGVKIIEESRDREYILKFSKEDTKDVDWEESRRLIHGSLLCLSADHFESVLFLVVTDSDVELLADGIVYARCQKGRLLPDRDKRTYVMAEPRAYFGAYRHVLEELQRLRLSDLMLKDFVVGKKNDCGEPAYLARLDAPMYNFASMSSHGFQQSYVWIRDLADQLTPEEIPYLDISQCEALYTALTKQVALIQGPPGTGKTFLVSKIVQVLLDNRSYWRERHSCSILVISYTNSALDQFLEKVLNFNDNIVRVGSQSKSQVLRPYMLSEIKERAKALGQTCSNVEICLRADVIGMTTSGAVRKKELLQILRPKIVIVEEAAFAPEAHIVVALTSSCEHLIMIGDHFQLKPPVSSSHLAKEPYNLSVSFFERLINNGMKPSILTIQYRMRPEISRLITPAIYPDLEDHESVHMYPSIRGMDKNVFFLVHNNKEQVYTDGRSRLNHFEVDMALALTRHLLRQGYKASQVTVLATYLGQKITALQSREERLKDVTVTTVDNFQGKESDIVILSLVRCNEDRNIGFLQNENRVCVALSRARLGFYLIGDMEALRMHSPLWAQIYTVLKAQQAVGDAFPLKCDVHGTITKAKERSQFPRGGGCSENCGSQLACGHICRQKCHAVDRHHVDYQCLKKCTRRCRMGHHCQKKCHEECAPCLVLVEKRPPCGHTRLVQCHQEPQAEDCKEPCKRKCPLNHPCSKECGEDFPPCVVEVRKQLRCGHWRTMECSSDPNGETCAEKVTKLLPCQHSKEVECSVRPTEIDCEELCSQSCPDGHPCTGKCNQQCPPCIVRVAKALRCGHIQDVECHKNPRRTRCMKPCAILCPNRHPCPMTCSHKCRPCKVPITKVLSCGHSKSVACHKDPSLQKCPEPCSRTCPKGHKCREKCWKRCPPCSVKIEKILPCGHRQLMECASDPSRQDCTAGMIQTFLCGHSKLVECGSDPLGEHCECLDMFWNYVESLYNGYYR